MTHFRPCFVNCLVNRSTIYCGNFLAMIKNSSIQNSATPKPCILDDFGRRRTQIYRNKSRTNAAESAIRQGLGAGSDFYCYPTGKWNRFAVKYLLRKCEMSAYADVGKFHFTSSKARYFTMCGSTLFHVLRKQNISLYAFVSSNAVLVKKKGRRIFAILRPFPVGRYFDFYTALSQIPLRVAFSRCILLFVRVLF